MSALVPAVATMLIFAYGYWNMTKVKETKYEIFTSKLIRDDGYRIAMISDLHYGLSLDSEQLQQICNEIENEKPDLVVLCGDIVDEATTLSEMKEVLKIIGNIKSAYGTFYVYGNHDKNNYSNKRYYSEQELSDELTKNKITILQDDTYLINNEFLIVGREERSSYRQSSEELFSNINKEDFILILDHQPCDLDLNDKIGGDLQLSGHTHGGQLWPMGLISDVIGVNEMNYGYKKLNNLPVITSSGIAGWGSPIRTEGNSEYVIIDVKR